MLDRNHSRLTFIKTTIFNRTLNIPDQCTTAVYQKSDATCACYFQLDQGLTWSVAAEACLSQGARLPEIYNLGDNDIIQALMVILIYFLRLWQLW